MNVIFLSKKVISLVKYIYIYRVVQNFSLTFEVHTQLMYLNSKHKKNFKKAALSIVKKNIQTGPL